MNDFQLEDFLNTSREAYPYLWDALVQLYARESQRQYWYLINPSKYLIISEN
jgi:hypothetical protein